MESNRELIIDDEFKNLIRPLYKQEYIQLEANILLDGCRNPITTWNGIIIDGHNRYEICNKHNIPYKVEEMAFNSREEVIAWICANQLGRRNLTEESRKFLIGKQYETEKIINSQKNAAGINQFSRPDESLPYEMFNPAEVESLATTKRKTAHRIAEANNISHGTVEKYAIYSKALEEIGRKEPKLESKILSGRYKISHDGVIALSKLSKKEIAKINNKLELNNPSFARYQTTRKEIQTLSEPKPRTRLHNEPSVKDMPEYDPDAEITGLTLTIPSWISSIERVRDESDTEKVSPEAKNKLHDALVELRRTSNAMLRKIGYFI